MSKLTISQVESYPFGTDPDRGISTITAERYGVRHTVDTSTGNPDVIFYPYYTGGTITGYKVRRLPKDFRPSVGKIGKSLFGRNTASPTPKYLLLTEGEEDCLAAREMVTSKALDVMSVPNGASMCSGISDESDLLMKYERIYLNFDSDKPGKAGCTDVADFLAPFAEVRIVATDDDASQMLRNGQQKEYKDAISKAKTYEPEGIVAARDLDFDEIFKPAIKGADIPFEGLQEKLHGIRKAEITTVCAGSGIGKSTLVRELTLSLLNQGKHVACVALEDQMQDAVQHLVAMDLNIPQHKIKFGAVPEDDLRESFDRFRSMDGLYFYKHFAGITSDSLMNKLYYYARSKAVDYIILDHLSLVISATDTNNERKAIDTLMTELAKMVVETGVGLVQIVHLKRKGGDTSYARGAEVELTDLRGSAAIEQLSWSVIGLERDQQGDDRDFSKVRVLKNRTYGFTGLADTVKYDATTGRMSSVAIEDIEEEEDESI
jgi:twinkle protein